MASAAAVVNGGFESGDFTGWTVVDAGAGNWSVYSGTTAPQSPNLTIGAPPEGTYGATTVQGGPGSSVLYQDVALEAGYTHTLKLSIYWVSLAGFVTPSPQRLDPNTSPPNQQYRIDILKPSAAVWSVDPADILASVYQSEAGDPLTQAPKEVSADLSALAGQTVRIRLAQAVTVNYFSAVVDGVRIDSAPIAAAAPVAAAAPLPTPDATVPAATAPAACTSQRIFTIRLRPARAALTSAVVTVNGKTVTVHKGKRLTAVVDLRGLEKGTYMVTIDARDGAGRHHRETRSYQTC